MSNLITKLNKKHCSKFHHVLLVDDDGEILDLLSEFLKINGYIVSKASNTKDVEELMQNFVFDAIIMDVMMPGEDGLQYIKRKRNELNVPVIMLTALGGVDDRIGGLENGADDYLTKPFEPKELLLRMEKLINMYVNRSLANANNQIVHSVAKFGTFTFDLLNHKLEQNGNNIHITNVEARLLHILATNSGKTVSRAEILNECEKNNININSRTIDTQIARLRNKIETNPKRAQFLSTTRGSGYILWATLI